MPQNLLRLDSQLDIDNELHALAQFSFIPYTSVQLWRCVTWRSRTIHSLCLLAIWVALGYSFDRVINYIIPMLLLIPLVISAYCRFHPPVAPQNRKEQLDMANEALSAMVHVGQWLSHLRWTSDPQSRRTFKALIYVNGIAIVLQQVLSIQQIILISGTVMLIGHHPWIVVLRRKLLLDTVVHIVIHVTLGPAPGDSPDDAASLSRALARRAEDYQRQVMHEYNDSMRGTCFPFTFVIYENQRYWPRSGWQNATLPFERAPWTDAALKRVAPKSVYALPETIQTNVMLSGDKSQRIRTWRWDWQESDWQADLKLTADVLGWSYGTAIWCSFDQTFKGVLSTRRRRWTRVALLTCSVEKDDTHSMSIRRQLLVSTDVRSSKTTVSTPMDSPPRYTETPNIIDHSQIVHGSASLPFPASPASSHATSSAVTSSTQDADHDHDALPRSDNRLSQNSSNTYRFSITSDMSNPSKRWKLWPTQKHQVRHPPRESTWRSIHVKK